MYLMMSDMLMAMLSALIAMAFYTLSERKLLGYMQHRSAQTSQEYCNRCPNGKCGETNVKTSKFNYCHKHKTLFTLTNNHNYFSYTTMTSLPHSNPSFFMKLGIIYFLYITSMMIYTTFMIGWSSNSKWAMLGALRSIAQTTSYEISMSLILIYFIIHASSTNLLIISQNQYLWIMVITLPLIIPWLISILAETHHAPMDFIEGESESVSSFNTEYSSSPFTLIFMAEYMNIILMSLITTSILSSEYFNLELISKTTILSIFFIWSRGALPRLRYDILMNSMWKKILPMSLMFMLFLIPLTKLSIWYCAGRTDNSDDIK